MTGMQCPLLSGLILFFAFLPIGAATVTVAKDGSGAYTSIQEAVNKAGPGDTVLVLDTAAYPEQVTIDGAKNGLTLKSKNPSSRSKPRIIWQDKANVGPTTAAEAQNKAMITYDRNGALRIIGARRVMIDGVAIDGGGVYPFGYNSIYGVSGQYLPLQHGNGAVVLYKAGDVIIKNCEVSNAYFGVYVKDNNEGGIFANANPMDIFPWNVVPMSGFGRAGNHLIEHNRIHDNSFGFYFESAWDLGSTIRYNLVYENHHPTDSVAAYVKRLTVEGANQIGGVMLLKDHLLSPLSIHNNTFRHNYAIFIGNWRAGAHHLIFNNIFAQPHRYWSDDPNFQNPIHELSPKFVNRMHACVFAAQSRKPSDSIVSIMNGMQVQASGAIPQGTPVTSPFPASADIRWVETNFASTDPASADFLVPDWNDTAVRKYIKDKGWTESGVTDPDGTPADLGAIPAGNGCLVDIVSIKPVWSVMIDGATANLKFEIDRRAGKMTSPVVKYFRYIKNVQFQQNAFGGNVIPVPAADIVTIPVPATPVALGSNVVSVTIPAADGSMLYAFFELIVEGTGSGGKPFTTATGFLPYRKCDHKFLIEVWDLAKTKKLTQVTVGDTVIINISAFSMDGKPFTGTIKPVEVDLASGCTLFTPGNPAAPFTLPEGITVSVQKAAIFSKAPSNGYPEYIHVTGLWHNGTFLGISESLSVRPDSASPGIIPCPAMAAATKKEACITWYDLRGKVISRQTITAATPMPSIRELTSRWKTGRAASVYLVRVELRDKVSGKIEGRISKAAVY